MEHDFINSFNTTSSCQSMECRDYCSSSSVFCGAGCVWPVPLWPVLIHARSVHTGLPFACALLDSLLGSKTCDAGSLITI
jgi:hypothetical protein